MQDARALPSTGFRLPFGLGRVTLERPLSLANNTKCLLPRQTARFAGSLVSSNGPDGAPQTALWPTPSMASPKPASNILVLAPNRGRAVLALIRFGPYVGCGCAIIPYGAPDPLNSTRRFAGGTNTVSARGFIYQQCKGLTKIGLRFEC